MNVKNFGLTNEQVKQFCKMMNEAFEEIRSLCWTGNPEQAGALSDAFHNLPLSLFDQNFDWERSRMYIGSYQKKFPTIVENDIVSGSYYDYLSMFDEIRNLSNK